MLSDVSGRLQRRRRRRRHAATCSYCNIQVHRLHTLTIYLNFIKMQQIFIKSLNLWSMQQQQYI